MTRPARQTKLLFLSSVAAAHQVAFCNALQEYFDARFWFYEQPDRARGAWWRVDLGNYCKVLDRVTRIPLLEARYLAQGLTEELEHFNPDVLMLGGFSIPSNYLAYRWARRKGRKTIVFTERSRKGDGKARTKGVVWRVLRWLYRDINLVIVSADDAVAQFRDDLGFGDKVAAGRYAADLDAFYTHSTRARKPAYTYLFANRLTDIYNPLLAIEIFAIIRSRHPCSRMLMNAAGELRRTCEDAVARRGLAGAVEFLTDIKSWSELHKVYERSDVLLLPAKYSNGNLTILEAMASGMGLIVSNRVLGIGKLVQDSHNGFSCEPTADAFVERIERYINDPSLFDVHGSLNRRLVAPSGPHGTAKHLAEIIQTRLAE